MGLGCCSHTLASPEAPEQRGHTIPWLGFRAAWAPTPERCGEDPLEPSELSCRFVLPRQRRGELRPPRLRFNPGFSPHLLPLWVTSDREGQSCLLCPQGPAGTALAAPSPPPAHTEHLMGSQCLGVLQGRHHIHFSAALYTSAIRPGRISECIVCLWEKNKIKAGFFLLLWKVHMVIWIVLSQRVTQVLHTQWPRYFCC